MRRSHHLWTKLPVAQLEVWIALTYIQHQPWFPDCSYVVYRRQRVCVVIKI